MVSVPYKKSAMIERDYIMRLISILTQVLSRVLLHRKSYLYPLARRELEGTYTSMFGMTGELLSRFSDEQLAGMFGSDDETVATKCYVLGVLMKEEGEIRQLEGDENNSGRLLLRALGLLLTSFLMMKRDIEPDHGQQIEALCAGLPSSGISAGVQEKLRSYHELRQVKT